jgi:acetylornithine deacetylase/succinyl-diaminopimelate desuccinylase-like protein
MAQVHTSTDREVMERIDRLIEEQLDSWLDRLAVLVNQPSISSQNVGMRECAGLVEQLLQESGFQTRLMPTESYPIVYAESAGRSDRTLICYNHYDVQPAEPLELWESPPFQATIRDGRMYGRGIQDDKGHFISRLAALSALREVLGELPCRVKFLVEGGEEISSPGVPEFVEEHRDLLAADGCVWETGGVGYDNRPVLMLGMRGICYVQYNAGTMSRDAHSGSAHLLPNAAWRLLRALATIKDEREHVLIDGFYEHVREPSELELRMLAEMHVDDEQMKRSHGIESFNLGLDGLAARRAVYSPTANIAGLSAGYEGEGPKTVIPAAAMAKMDFRLVPDQDPMDILHKLRAHLDRHGFDDVEIEYLGGERPGQTPPDDPFVQLTLETAREIYGTEPSVVPLTGGSGPMAPFRDSLRVPIVTLGISHPEAMVHAPNEHIRLDTFLSGTRHMARLVQRFPSLQG